MNARTFDGTTPIRLAEGRRMDKTVKMLLERGADFDSLNFDDVSDVSSDMSDSEEEMVSVREFCIYHRKLCYII